MSRTPRPAPPTTRIVRAGGAVVWRLRDTDDFYGAIPTDESQIEVLLVHRPRYGDWSFPKGKLEPGEQLVPCAVREVEEETGQVIRLGAPLTVQRYRLNGGHLKEVYYWVGTLDVGFAAKRLRPPAKAASENEIDEVAWVRCRKAAKILTRRGDRRLLEELVTRLENGTLVTSTVMMVRHAKALGRSQWQGAEGTRPLAREGSHQALALCPILSAYGIEKIFTSPWRRCLATVGAYASLGGCEVKVCEELTEDAYAEDSRQARTLMNRVLGENQRPLAMSLHRPSLPGLLGELALVTPNALTRLIPQEDPYLKTAEFLVAHVAHPGGKAEVIALERHRAASV